jgi:hypothetical protein
MGSLIPLTGICLNPRATRTLDQFARMFGVEMRLIINGGDGVVT